MTLLRLPAEVLPVFQERLASAYPNRASKVWSNIEQARGGKRNEYRFGARMEGVGPRWAAIENLFEIERRRLGYGKDDEDHGEPRRNTFRRPARETAQGNLFDSP